MVFWGVKGTLKEKCGTVGNGDATIVFPAEGVVIKGLRGGKELSIGGMER